ncbi:MAG TPA: hypothetical protein PKI32_07010 [Opitutales bacterium]|nr:hypothetical protein [Opitutales bacterium]
MTNTPKIPTFTEGRPILSALLTLPLALALALLLTGGHDVLSQGDRLFAYLTVWLGDCALFFLMLYTAGRTVSAPSSSSPSRWLFPLSSSRTWWSCAAI